MFDIIKNLDQSWCVHLSKIDASLEKNSTRDWNFYTYSNKLFAAAQRAKNVARRLPNITIKPSRVGVLILLPV